ncbi:MAG: helix-turn-helix transcriptional regulator [Lentisphaeria bacterium]|nr:helix-turn-helix transcriptional regulator [Lentisphaeria bacterium]
MLRDLILSGPGMPPNGNFMAGYRLPEKFELPDDILVFMHDWFPSRTFQHSRYMLILPAVPIEYRIDNNVHYRVEPGQVMFSPPCQNRELLFTSDDTLHGYPRLLITFTLSRDAYYLPDSLLLDISPKAERILSALLSAYRKERNADLAIQLFFLLRELSRHQAAAQPVRYSPVVLAALRHINHHSGGRSSLAEMAAAAKTSVSNLRLLFKKELGRAPGQFVAGHRLKVAQYDLAMTSKRVDEVAQICGFRSVYAFSHFFKKHTGMSPLAWRKVNRFDDPDPGRTQSPE